MKSNVKKKILSVAMLAMLITPSSFAATFSQTKLLNMIGGWLNTSAEESNNSSKNSGNEQEVQEITTNKAGGKIVKEEVNVSNPKLESVENLKDQLEGQFDANQIGKDLVENRGDFLDRFLDRVNGRDLSTSANDLRNTDDLVNGNPDRGNLRNDSSLGMASDDMEGPPPEGALFGGLKRTSADTAHETLNPGEKTKPNADGDRFIKSANGKMTIRINEEGEIDDRKVDSERAEMCGGYKAPSTAYYQCITQTGPFAPKEDDEECIQEDNCDDENSGPRYTVGGHNFLDFSQMQFVPGNGAGDCDYRNENNCDDEYELTEEDEITLRNEVSGCTDERDGEDCQQEEVREMTQEDSDRNDIGPMPGDFEEVDNRRR